MPDIGIGIINASWLSVSGDSGVMEDVYEYFKLEDPDFRPNKYSRYDGKIRLFDKRTGKFPYGLLHVLLELTTQRRWSYNLDPELLKDFRAIPKQETDEWAKTLLLHDKGKPIEPYDYQLEGLHLAANNNRITLLAATAAGKSLLQYMMVRFYLNAGMRILLIVPSINLVSQMVSDFKNYSSANGWDAEGNVHMICEGATPWTSKPVVVATWQSLKNLPEEWFHQWDMMIGDECHTFSAECLTYIGKNCINARNRYGLTGTLKKGRNHPLQVQQHFGPVRRLVTAKQLQDSGRAAKTRVIMIQINHKSEDRVALAQDRDYQKEIEFIISNEYRNRIIKNICLSAKGNTLVLFDRIDTHLELVKKMLEGNDSVLVRVIDGDVANADRDVIKAEMEGVAAGKPVVLLATSGCVSTGVSIKNLHNLVFTHPSKSSVKVIQSIGRTIRLHDSKEVATIYDLVDDLSYAGWINHALRHASERLAIYDEEQHPVETHVFNVSGLRSVTTKLV
ncbi:DNA helicase UvsW [Delftia phage PhiW-14]|uniref:DNA helicase UvsW n=1 Tax=Delftia phage PhiW-14 TaxID=665032 RepID=C9DG02_BPW14|nr:DNA helicase [Delftia phage PhiW-14]ACV50053.1 DNA helicase UvsW [Delftia phage PhiW-14]